MEYSKYKRQNGYIRQNGVISISANGWVYEKVCLDNLSNYH